MVLVLVHWFGVFPTRGVFGDLKILHEDFRSSDHPRHYCNLNIPRIAPPIFCLIIFFSKHPYTPPIFRITRIPLHFLSSLLILFPSINNFQLYKPKKAWFTTENPGPRGKLAGFGLEIFSFVLFRFLFWGIISIVNVINRITKKLHIIILKTRNPYLSQATPGYFNSFRKHPESF